MGKKVFWIHFSKKNYPYGVKVNILAKVLKNFSGLYSSIAEFKNLVGSEQYSKKKFIPIFLNQIREGSIAFGIKMKVPSHVPPLIGKDPFDIVEDDVKTIIQIENENDRFYNKFIDEYPNPKNRVRLLKYQKNLNPYYKEDYRITYTAQNENFERSEIDIVLNRTRRNKINELIKKEKIEDKPKIDGEFIGFKNVWGTFWIIDLQGKEIKCNYEENNIQISSLKEKNLYRVFGDYSETPGRKPIVSDIMDIIWLCKVEDFQYLNKYYEKRILFLKKIKSKSENEMNRQEYSTETINNTLFFIAKFRYLYKKKIKDELPLPMIFPGAFGKMELEWTELFYNLQITIPKKIEAEIIIYAYDEDEFYEEVELENKLENLFKWLAKRK